MESLLNGEVECRVSTSYDPFPPEEITKTNEDESFMEYTNREVGQNEMETYDEWHARREGVKVNGGETSTVDVIVRGESGRLYCRKVGVDMYYPEMRRWEARNGSETR